MSQEEAFAARVGTTLNGKWKLERLLGAGGMAAVYVGVHRIGRRDAIKILHPEIARSRELRVRFEQEAQAVNRFSHPGAVEIRDIDVTEDGAPFLVMELLDGEPLSARLSNEAAIDEGELLRLADEMLAVLAAAHARGIIHRDIKPDNLFILRDGRLKVLDFGIARVKDGGHSIHTKTGAALGTLAYMSPEQIRGLEIDARADLFSVGATLFRLVARRRIHDARSESELIVKMATQPAPRLVEVAPAASPALAAIVDRALAFDRDKRYPDALTMQRDVQAARAGRAPPFASAPALAAGGAAAAASAPGRSVVVPASGFAAGAGALAADAATIAPGQLTVGALLAGAGLGAAAAAPASAAGRDGATRMTSDGLSPPPGAAASSPGIPGIAPAGPAGFAAISPPPPTASGAGAPAEALSSPAIEPPALERTGPSRAAFAQTMLAGRPTLAAAARGPKDEGTRRAIVAICALGAFALLAALGTGLYFAGRSGAASADASATGGATEGADAGRAAGSRDPSRFPSDGAGEEPVEVFPPIKGKGKGRGHGKKTRYIIVEGAD